MKLTIITLITLASFFSFKVQAQCIQGSDCSVETPSEPTEVKPAPPAINLGESFEQPFLFNSHLDAEGNYFHMLEGLAIMTIEIQKRIPDFQGFPLSIFLDRQYQDCRQAPGQIYSQADDAPYMGVCFVFNSQKEAEGHYKFGVTTYYQYWDLLQKLMKSDIPPCIDGGDFKDGAYQGALWKPVADPKALCSGGTTILLPGNYVGRVSGEMDILDVNFRKIGSARQLPYSGRVRYCSDKPGAAYGEIPLVVRYSVDGVLECRTVDNASKRED